MLLLSARVKTKSIGIKSCPSEVLPLPEEVQANSAMRRAIRTDEALRAGKGDITSHFAATVLRESVPKSRAVPAPAPGHGVGGSSFRAACALSMALATASPTPTAKAEYGVCPISLGLMSKNEDSPPRFQSNAFWRWSSLTSLGFK